MADNNLNKTAEAIGASGDQQTFQAHREPSTGFRPDSGDRVLAVGTCFPQTRPGMWYD